jgi:hypothetical protein
MKCIKLKYNWVDSSKTKKGQGWGRKRGWELETLGNSPDISIKASAQSENELCIQSPLLYFSACVSQIVSTLQFEFLP